MGQDLIDKYNPWYYLGSGFSKLDIITARYGGMISSLFVTMRVIGIFGAAITFVIAFARYSAAEPYKKADIKNVITGKVLVVILLFGASWLMSLVLGILLSM